MDNQEQRKRLYNQVKSAVKFAGPPNILKASRWIAAVDNFKTRYPLCFEYRHDVDEVIECLLEGAARTWWDTVCRTIDSTNWPAFTAAFLSRWGESKPVIYQRWQSMRFSAGTDPLEWGDAIQTYARSLGVSEEQGVLHIQSAIQDASLKSQYSDRRPITIAQAINVLQELVSARSWPDNRETSNSPYNHTISSASPSSGQQHVPNKPFDVQDAIQSLSRSMQELAIRMTQVEKVNTGGYPRRGYNQGNSGNPAMHHNNHNDHSQWNRQRPEYHQNNRSEQPVASEQQTNVKTNIVTVDEPCHMGIADIKEEPKDTETSKLGVHMVHPFGDAGQEVKVGVQRMPAKRVPISVDPTNNTDAAQLAPPMPQQRALPPDYGIPEAFTEQDVLDATARRLLAQRTTCTLRELYTIGSQKFRAKVQQHFNNMHAAVETPNNSHPVQVSTNAVSNVAYSPRQHVAVSHTMTGLPEPLLEIDGYINGMQCVLTLDTGAQFNVMTTAAAYALQAPVDINHKTKYKGVDGVPQVSVGTCGVNVRIGKDAGIVSFQEFMIVDDNESTGYTILMGLPWFKAMRANIDVHNCRIVVQKDENTTVSFPFLQPKCLKPLSVKVIQQAESQDSCGDIDIDTDGEYDPDADNLSDAGEDHHDVPLMSVACSQRPRQHLVPILKKPSDMTTIQKTRNHVSFQDCCSGLGIGEGAANNKKTPFQVAKLETVQPDRPFGLDYFAYTSVQSISKQDYAQCMCQCSEPIDATTLPSINTTQVVTSDRLPEEEVKTIDVPGFDKPITVGKDTPERHCLALANLLVQFHDVFAHSVECLNKPSRLPAHSITLLPGSKPVQVPMRAKPMMEQRAETSMVREQAAVGIIAPSKSPWRAPVMVIKKHVEPGTDVAKLTQGDLFRVVVDYRLLNDLTISDAYPMPLIYEVIERAAIGHLFSKLDIKSAFYQVPLEEDSRAYTAFATKDGLFEYQRMPMGLKNAPATFARGMKVMLGDSDAAVNYADDLIIPSPLTDDHAGSEPGSMDGTYEDQLAKLRQVFTMMRDFNLKCTSHKCVFFTKATRFVGHILRAGTISTDPNKTRVIDNIDPSKGFAHLQRFLAYVYYYALRQIPHLSSRTKLLRSLLVKNTPWQWTDKHQILVDELKAEVKKRYVLHAPNWNKPFILQTDYSKDGLAAVLSQIDADGVERLICCASRATTKAEAVYSAYEGELAAVVYGVLAFHYYLYGRHFQLVTDHLALQYLSRQTNSNTRLGRIAALLSSEYSFEVVHRKGRLHCNVDMLSRDPPQQGIQEVHRLGDNVLYDFPMDMHSGQPSAGQPSLAPVAPTLGTTYHSNPYVVPAATNCGMPATAHCNLFTAVPAFGAARNSMAAAVPLHDIHSTPYYNPYTVAIPPTCYNVNPNATPYCNMPSILPALGTPVTTACHYGGEGSYTKEMIAQGGNRMMLDPNHMETHNQSATTNEGFTVLKEEVHEQTDNHELVSAATQYVYRTPAPGYTPAPSPEEEAFDEAMEFEPEVRICLTRVTPVSLGLSMYNSNAVSMPSEYNPSDSNNGGNDNNANDGDKANAPNGGNDNIEDDGDNVNAANEDSDSGGSEVHNSEGDKHYDINYNESNDNEGDKEGDIDSKGDNINKSIIDLYKKMKKAESSLARRRARLQEALTDMKTDAVGDLISLLLSDKQEDVLLLNLGSPEFERCDQRDPLYYHPSQLTRRLPVIAVLKETDAHVPEADKQPFGNPLSRSKPPVNPSPRPIITRVGSATSNKQSPAETVSRPLTFADCEQQSSPQSPKFLTDQELRHPQLRALEAAHLPIPRYVPLKLATEDGDEVPIDQPCDICKMDNRNEELLVCDNCNSMIHTYCLDDAMPEGVVPEGQWLCPACAPTAGNEPAGYSDIWSDEETLEVLMQGTTPMSDRVRERAKRYNWDNDKQLLYTTEQHPRIIPKPAQRNMLAKAAHEVLGHRGYRSIADALRIDYRWKSLREDVKKAVESCESCSTKTLDVRALRNNTLQSIPPNPIFTRWTIDLIGPMPTSGPNSYKYIAVGVDSYSKWVVASPITNKKAATIVDWFDAEIVCKYGSPYQVNCDRGGEFFGAFQSFCDKHAIKIVRGSAYHPQTQGLVERVNQTLQRAISSYVGDQHDSWSKYVHKTVFAINACKQASTRYSPFYLVYGVQPRLPLQLPDADVLHVSELTDADAALVELADRTRQLNEAHQKVVDNVTSSQKRQAEQYAVRQGSRFSAELPNVGDHVYMLCRGDPNKQEGPYLVSAVSEKTVTLKDGMNAEWKVSVDHVRVPVPGSHMPVMSPNKRRITKRYDK